jgi:hypothetical protein
MTTKKKVKLARSAKPTGRQPVISGRVPQSLHEQIKRAAKASGRSMSEELAWRASQSFERKSVIEEILALAYGPDLASIFAMAHKSGMLRLSASHKEELRARTSSIIDAIPGPEEDQ